MLLDKILLTLNNGESDRWICILNQDEVSQIPSAHSALIVTCLCFTSWSCLRPCSAICLDLVSLYASVQLGNLVEFSLFHFCVHPGFLPCFLPVT